MYSNFFEIYEENFVIKRRTILGKVNINIHHILNRDIQMIFFCVRMEKRM
jgi:hypothetical protein